MKIKKILLLGILFNTTFLMSQISTDRPGASDASNTVMKGSFQIEQGFDLSFYSEDTINFRAFAMPSLFRIGVAKWFEIRVLNNIVSTKNKVTDKTRFGIADIELGFKAQLLKKEGVNMEIVLVSMWGMPIGTDGLTTGKFSANNKLSIGHSLGDVVGMTYNIGYSYYGFGNGNLNYTMNFSFQLTDKLGLFIENFGSYVNFKEFVTSADAGLAFKITDWLQADFSFGTGLNWKYNFAQLGISWNIHKKEKE